jgi:hypothetical protein
MAPTAQVAYKQEYIAHNDTSMTEIKGKETILFLTFPPIEIESQVNCMSVVGDIL